MARSFNYIYEKLVRSEGDMVGHIAYSIYKKEKQAFISDWRLKNPGKNIPEEVLDTFHTSASTDVSIKNYRAAANDVLQSFTSKVLVQKISETEKQCLAEQQNQLKEIIKPISTSQIKQYIHGSIQSVIGAFIFAAILALCSLINLFHSYDVKFSITPTQSVNQTDSINNEQ